MIRFLRYFKSDGFFLVLLILVPMLIDHTSSVGLSIGSTLEVTIKSC